MATQTEHLHLIRPDPDDFYDIAEFNANMDLLDRWIGSVQDRISYVLTASVSGGNLTVTPKDGRTEPKDGMSCLICLTADLTDNAMLAFAGGTAYPLYLPTGNPVTQGTAVAGAYIHVLFNEALGRWYLIGGSGESGSNPHVFIQKEEPEEDNCFWIKPVNEDWVDPIEVVMIKPWFFIQKEEPEKDSCFWVKPIGTSLIPEDGEIVLNFSDNPETAKYFVEIDGQDRPLENVVDSDSELAAGNYKIEIL